MREASWLSAAACRGSSHRSGAAISWSSLLQTDAFSVEVKDAPGAQLCGRRCRWRVLQARSSAEYSTMKSCKPLPPYRPPSIGDLLYRHAPSLRFRRRVADAACPFDARPPDRGAARGGYRPAAADDSLDRVADAGCLRRRHVPCARRGRRARHPSSLPVHRRAGGRAWRGRRHRRTPRCGARRDRRLP